MDETVPVTKSIDTLYPDANILSQRQRWQGLIRQFRTQYGKKPLFVARSPGRVNLIGEHIDYSLYEVLPMAIAADVLIAVAVSSPEEDGGNGSTDAVIPMLNINPHKHRPSECTVPSSGEADIDATVHEWTNYFKAGFNGAVDLLRKENKAFSPCSMQILVDGNVPAGGGLSSSAAFVCASALAVLRANGREDVKKKELVELAIVSERAVGVNSGGMDQSASVFAVKGDALGVSFSPELYVKAIPFPKVEPPITFMIAQSFVTSDKHVTAPRCYNLRVVECTLAAEVMAAKLGIELQDDSGPLRRSLRGLQHAFFSTSGGKTTKDPSRGDPQTPYKQQLQQMLSMTPKFLDQETGYTRSEIAETLHISLPTLESRYMTTFPVQANHFHLGKRAQHVFSEALRVLAFKELLQNFDFSNDRDLLPRLGALMNETQESCRDVYECSCPEIDQLCSIARDAGAYGSRLTGAGWGGCTVHLVPKDRVDAVRAKWIEEYYRRREPDISDEKLEEAVVVSEPGQGAVV
ncbi:MAG: hypothetical protein LQ350_008570 [Teloschistes chrysophthalmus]|nr:MAG: hypothetical protein LQ350_008570 [Niorma chrysophthalma]